MSAQPVICLYGGAFDPVHNGHLRIAWEASQALHAQRLYFIPTGRPAHRSAAALNAPQRYQLLQLATAEQPLFSVSDFEIQRAEQGHPSYAIDTLLEFKQRYPDARLCWLMGSDAFAQITEWHQWQRLFELANVIVAGRPGATGYNDPVTELLKQRQISCADALPEGGAILPIEVTQLDISSTAIREQLALGQLPNYLVPEAVLSALAMQK